MCVLSHTSDIYVLGRTGLYQQLQWAPIVTWLVFLGCNAYVASAFCELLQMVFERESCSSKMGKGGLKQDNKPA